jgi:RNA polymerase sigma factor (sigma-70 family)
MDATRLLRLARESAPPACGDPADTELLRRYAADRDEAAFAELVRRNGPLVLRTCRHVLGSACAEDAFQATFLLLARSAGRFTRPGSLAAWLHAAAVRIARRARRGEGRRREREVGSCTTPLTSDDLTWREVREVLDAELALLPEKYRVPLVLCYLQELSYEEAAGRAGCSVGALRGRLERGKERLRKRLARHGLPLAMPALILGAPAPVSAALTGATLGIARTTFSGGRVSAAVARLAQPRTGLKVGFLAPVAVALAAVGAVLAGAARPDADPPTSATRPADPPAAPATPGEPAPRTDLFGDPLPDGAVARLGTTRCRTPVFAFGIQSDGTVVTIAGVDPGMVRTWGPNDDRPASSTPVRLDAPERGWPCAGISPDARYLVGKTSETVVVWERTNSGLKKVASFDIGRANQIAFSPDGARLAAIVWNDKTGGVYLCDLATGKATKLPGSADGHRHITFSGDGRRLAATTGDDRAILWDATTGQKLAECKTGGIRYSRVALDRTGGVMAMIPYRDPDPVMFVDPKTGKQVEGLTGPTGGDWVEYAPDGKTVLVRDDDGIRWWDPAAGKLIRTFEGATWIWGSAAFSPDGKVLVSHTEYMLLRWNARTGQPLFPAAHSGGHQGAVWSIGVSADGKTVATAGGDWRVRTWDATTGKPLHSFPSGGSSHHTFSTDGRFLYAQGPDRGGPMKWDLTTGKLALRFAFDPAGPRQVAPVAVWLSPDGRTLAAISSPYETADPHMLTVWDTDTGARLRTPRLPASRKFLLGTVTFSPDGRWVTVGGMAFPVEAGPGANTLPEEAARLEASGAPGAFSPDSRLVTVPGLDFGGPDGGGRWFTTVYEVATGAKVRDLPPDTSGGFVTFHPDGRTLATAGPAEVSFWDLAAGKRYATRNTAGRGGKSDPSPVGSLRYFPGGKKLVTGHADTTALVWEAPARPESARALDEKGRATAWADLASPDGAKGWAAVWALADDPGMVAFLRQKVRPVEALTAKEFDRLLADLGSDDFATREAATEKLMNAGESAVGQLRSALRADPTAEQKARIERLLAGWMGADRKAPTGARLRVVRAIAAVELAGTADARKLLAELAAGAPEATTTREAKWALERARR